MQAGDVLADRYRLDDLLAENGTGRFWRAHDRVLHRAVAVHVLAADDERAGPLLEAARRAGPVIDRRLLRVLDAEVADGRCYVVNEWGQGDSLDVLLTREGPLPPRRAAWLVAEVADTIAEAHALGLAHGRLAPENVLVDQHGQVRIIGFGVDAALRGLAPGRTGVDEIDLVGLLYAALTGRWAGVSQSALPPAPEAHGTVLRPRRVRAGIPRVLDTLCDQVLAPQHSSAAASDLSARAVRDLLADYVGEMTGTHVPVAGPRPAGPPSAPAVQPEPVPEPEPVAAEDAEATAVTPALEPTDVPEPVEAADTADPIEPTEQVAPVEPTTTGDVSSTDLPTQAGMPVFHDDDDEVDWLRARADKPAPPPLLDEPAPKPLFAPDPPEGEPVRRPRPGSRAASAGPDYWPWDASSPGPDSGVRPVSRDTGGWGTGSWSGDPWGTDDGLQDTGDQVPGRSWFRLALVVAVLAVVAVAAVAAYQLGLPAAIDDATDDPTTSASPSAADPTPYTGLVADDFDPQGAEPREENPESVPNVVDGDPATTWSTSTYKQNFGPGGLKTGVGVIVDLGATKGVRRVVVTTDGGQTSLAAYVTTQAPTGVADLSPIGTASGTGELTIDVPEAVSGRYVTIWLTLLPAVSDGFRGTISEVQVLG
ncbi:protein kinase [Nocardioides sp. J2M5]|uniref:protein kinase domain-containing protein n=1 Tax=Nocardioides palaemonis TaxID=2829810 RepID=UPI001BAAA6E1|nr:protein kinase [Nocardioides palaemonis]MBS2940232.1 protein kinase [Nocardioides palaemonis]